MARERERAQSEAADAADRLRKSLDDLSAARAQATAAQDVVQRQDKMLNSQGQSFELEVRRERCHRL
jgi:hypothetical protein